MIQNHLHIHDKNSFSLYNWFFIYIAMNDSTKLSFTGFWSIPISNNFASCCNRPIKIERFGFEYECSINCFIWVIFYHTININTLSRQWLITYSFYASQNVYFITINALTENANCFRISFFISFFVHPFNPKRINRTI